MYQYGARYVPGSRVHAPPLQQRGSALAPHIVVGRKEVTNFRPTTMDVLVPSAFSAPTSAAVDVVQQATPESQEL